MSVTDCQLLNACGTAYGVDPSGSFTKSQPYYDQVGWTTLPAPLVAGPYSSDAAVVGTVSGATIVAFRGTEQLIGDPIDWGQVFDWLSNDFLGLPPMDFPTESSWGKVHTGWWQSVDALWSKLTALAIDYTKPVYFTGHSKGGPMASLAAMRLAAEGVDTSNVKIVTFASPHPGDTTFAATYAKQFPDAYGYANHLDIVPLLPFSKAMVDILDLKATGLLKGLLNLVWTWDYQQAGSRTYYENGQVLETDKDGSYELAALMSIKTAVENAPTELAGLELVTAAHSMGCPTGNSGGYTEAACASTYRGYCTGS